MLALRVMGTVLEFSLSFFSFLLIIIHYRGGVWQGRWGSIQGKDRAFLSSSNQGGALAGIGDCLRRNLIGIASVVVV